MSLTASRDGLLTGLGVATFTGVGVVGSVVAGFGLVSSPQPVGPAPAAVREAPCSGEVLPTLGGGEGAVVGAGGPALLAGMSSDASGRSWPVLWRRGEIARLTTGLDPATVADVNRAGLVVGSGYDAGNDTSVAWAWADGRTWVLRAPGGASAVAEAVDDSGRIVGSVEVGEDEQAAVWDDVAGPPVLLDPLPGDQGAHAFAVAPDGTVGGVSLGDGGTPVIWPAGGSPRALGTPSTQGVVLGFDDESRPVGTAYGPDGRGSAALWPGRAATSRLPGPQPAGTDAVVGGAGEVRAGTTGGSVAGNRPLATLWRPGAAPGVLAPARAAGFRGVASAATAVTGGPERPEVVGYSADEVGRRVPTVWRCR